MAAERQRIHEALYYNTSTMMLIWGFAYLFIGIAALTWGWSGPGRAVAGSVLEVAAIAVAVVSLVHSYGVDARSVRVERAVTLGAMSLIFIAGAIMIVARDQSAHVIRIGAFGAMIVLMLWVASGFVMGQDKLRGMVAACLLPTIIIGFVLPPAYMCWAAIGGGLLGLALVVPVKRFERRRWQLRDMQIGSAGS